MGSAVGTLSGGNQQKVAVGKWLGTEPKVMLLEEPTRGVDIGARAEIYQRLRDLCAAGLGIVVASSDTAEMLGLSDTIATFYRGRLTGDKAAGGMDRGRPDPRGDAPGGRGVSEPVQGAAAGIRPWRGRPAAAPTGCPSPSSSASPRSWC